MFDQFMETKIKRKAGFTLIEVFVVTAILGIIAFGVFQAVRYWL